MVDKATIAWYDDAAQTYENLTKISEPSASLRAFMALLPAGAEVLDLGCGAAAASVHMRAAGFQPDPVDASHGLIDLANQAHDIGARYMTFDDLDAVATYDGVWANFALLHAPHSDLGRHIAAIATALRANGIFHIAMTVGTGEKRDAINRKYTYVTVAELRALLENAGFKILTITDGTTRGAAGTVDTFVVIRAQKDTNA